MQLNGQFNVIQGNKPIEDLGKIGALLSAEVVDILMPAIMV